MARPMLVWSTVPEEAVGVTLADRLVSEGLAACVHVMPQGLSVYRWQGQVERTREWTLLIKSDERVYPRLEERLRQLHPYQVPEILAVPVVGGLPAYLAWLATALDDGEDANG